MDTAPDTAAPVSLFYSYAHEDEPLREELQGHLKILERRGLLAPWHDRKIVPGQDWSGEIDAHLRSAELVLLLVSKDFVESDYIWGVELVAAMDRHARQAATVVPIMVRPVDLAPEDAPFMKLQGLPTDMKPVTSWPNRDEAWTDVAKGLRATVKGIRERRPAPARLQTPPAPAPVRDAGADPVLDRLVGNVTRQIEDAQRARNEAPLGEEGLQQVQDDARALIDVREQKRILWVDDRPSNNYYEAAALAKLQIEVVAARSTDEAMRRIAQDAEGFDLVISDWDRDGEPPDAGLLLAQRLRAGGVQLPIVYYHAAQGGRRARRAVQARAAGAIGEAVLPHELMALAVQALAGPAR